MKKLLLTAVAAVTIFGGLNAQNAKNQIIGTASTTHDVNGNTLSWSLGEPIVGNIDINDKLITQGFHQPYLFDCNLEVDATITCVGSDEYMVSLNVDGAGSEFKIESPNENAFNGVIAKEFSEGPFENNSTYTFTVFNKTRDYCNKTLTIQNVDCQSNSLQLLSFVGEVNATGNLLDWSTYGSLKNGALQIQKSEDGVNYESILTYTPENSDFTKKSFIDKNAKNGLTHYKLCKLDQTGKVEEEKELNLLRIESMATVNYKITTYPNPVIDELNISLEDYNKKTVLVGLYSTTGNILMSEEYNAESNNIKIDLRGLGNSVYLLSIATPQGELITTQKIQKLD